MMRFIAFILTCLFAIAALAASNNADPFMSGSIVVEAHSPGHWLFNEADYQRCVTVSPAPLEPRQSGINLYPRRSDTA